MRSSIDPDRLHALVASLRDFAVRAKGSLDDEIRSYPTPIPRCDAQFNHAYAQRALLAALLQRIPSEPNDDDNASAMLSAMAEFAASPPIGESAEERALRARIADELAGAGVPIVASAERSTADLSAGSH
ncbi:MAG TPA: hypothetical protein VFJ68_09965 [Casimicrobiaceae bacterium]|nr:hypothetical protein [Casimicrobiaceae bacterium]